MSIQSEVERVLEMIQPLTEHWTTDDGDEIKAVLVAETVARDDI